MPLNNPFVLDVDLKEVNYAYERRVTANDSTTFIVNLTNEGMPVDLTNVTTVSLANTRLDQTSIVTPGTKTGPNQVTFNLGQNETKVSGRVTAIVQLYDAEGRVSSLAFNYTVVKDPTGSTYVPIGEEKTLIQVVLGDGPLVLQQARDATKYAIERGDAAVAYSKAATDTVVAETKTKTDAVVSSMNAAVDSTVIVPQPPVTTYANLPANPQKGWLVQVTSDPDANKNGNYRYSGTAWVLVQKGDLTGKANVADVNAVDVARADIVRQMVHSGVVELSTNWKNDYNDANKNENRVFRGYSDSLVNSFQTEIVKAIINGYKLDANAFGRPLSTQISNLITLPAPPTFGTREDLVFLEAWFDPATPSKLSWRIRTVAGVDFTKNYMDGFSAGTQGRNILVTAQGGNSSPYVPASPTDALYSFNRGDLLGFPDVGLYVSGSGNQESKSTLKTADGYVYAIPLFRVKRRNSGGYRADNLNGAREYYSSPTQVTVNFPSYPMELVQGKDYEMTLTNVPTDFYKHMRAGDKLVSGTTDVYTIISIDPSNNKIVGRRIGWTSTTNSSQSYTGVTGLSDRPDGLFANIIDKDDIIDLRHKVSLTGYNYQQLLEENFDKLLRGELQTKDKPVLAKHRFNLQPAPSYVKPELQGVRRLGNDGVERELVNILGNKPYDDYSGSASHSDVLGSDGYTTTTITSSGSKIVGAKLDPSKWYLINLDIKEHTFTSISFYYQNTSLSYPNLKSNLPLGRTMFKFKLPNDYAPTRPAILFGNTGSTQPSGNRVSYKLAVYEIDQATYDKIDVDPAFTGEELAKKFPYVSSYPNVVENVAPTEPNEWEHGNINSSTGLFEANNAVLRTINYIPISLSVGTIIQFTNASDWLVGFRQFDVNNNFLGTSSTILPNAVKIKLITFKSGYPNLTPNDIVSARIMVEVNSHLLRAFVPYGKWYLPQDIAEAQTPINYNAVNERHRKVSDAQTSEVHTDLVEALNTPQKHLTVTQATKGQWSVGDKIAIKSTDGVITGTIDSDTALARIAEDTTSGSITSCKVDDVSKLSVGDVFRFLDTSNMWTSNELTISAIDTTNKVVTFNAITISLKSSTHMIVETTTSSSLPVTTATGIAGTWSGLGTKEATYTLTTAPTDNKATVKIDYTVNYPAGKGLPNLPSEVLEARVNGQKLVKASNGIVNLKFTLEGKVSGSTDLVPHSAKVNTGSTSLVTPSGSWAEMNSSYALISKLDGGTPAITSASNAGGIAQHLIGFDIIRGIADKLGWGFFHDCNTLAEMITKIKNTVSSSIRINWYGKGTSPAGNKATIAVWSKGGSNYTSATSHGSNTHSLLAINLPINTLSTSFDTDGIVYYIAYADPATGVTTDANGGASTIETDYVEMIMELNVAETGYDVFVPEEPKPILSENIAPSGIAFPMDTSTWVTSIGYVINSHATVTKSNPQQGVIRVDIGAFSGDQRGIGVVGDGGIDIPLGSGFITFKLKASKNLNYHISSPYSSGFAWNATPTSTPLPKVPSSTEWTQYTLPFNATTSKLVFSIFTSGDPSGVWAEIKEFAITKTANTLWTPGRKKKTTHTFLGKVVGSTDVPHKAFTKTATTFGAPSTFTSEVTNGVYNSLSKSDGNVFSVSTGITGEYAQALLEYDLSHLGLSLSELKKALRKHTITVMGNGSGDNGGVRANGMQIRAWDAIQAWTVSGNSMFASNTSSIPFPTSASGTLTGTQTTTTPDQKVYILLQSTYPAGSGIESVLTIDHVKLDVELADYVDYVKSNVVKVRKETKEMKLQYLAKDYRTGVLDTVELWYKTVPYQGIGKKSAKIIAMMDDLVVTTYGTGKYNGLSSAFRGASTRLPKPTGFSDHLLIEDTITSAIQGDVGVYLAPIRTVEKGQYLNSMSYVSVNDGLTAFSDDLPTSIPHLVMLAYLTVLDGELRMKIRNTYLTNKLVYNANSSVTDDFTIDGRPLIKGVN